MRFKLTALAIVFCIATGPVHAQINKDYYSKRWKLADSLMKKGGLPKSALDVLDEIYATAKKEGNDVQQIKALLKSFSLRDAVGYDLTPASLKQMETEAAAVSQPVKSILLHFAAKQYAIYYLAHRSEIAIRTETVNYVKEDIATWSAEDFYEKSRSLFLQSLQDTASLQQARVQDYEDLLMPGNFRYLRPTLFDLLAHNTIEFFADEAFMGHSLDYELFNKIGYASGKDFLAMQFTSNDTAGTTVPALQLLQQAIRFHTRDKDTAALIDADLKRLELVNKFSTLEQKDSLLEEALRRVAEQFNSHPAAEIAWYSLVKLYLRMGEEYRPLSNPVHQYELVKARKICEQIVARKDTSATTFLFKWMIKSITNQEISFEAEKVNQPGKPFRMLAKFKNLSQVKMRIVRTTKDMNEHISSYRMDDKYWKSLLAKKPEREYIQELPLTQDHQTHSVEIKIDALPPGTYVLLANYGKKFDYPSDSISPQFFTVSNIACINNGKEVFVVDRENGRPIAGAILKLWDRNWRNDRMPILTGKTDINGYGKINSTAGRSWYSVAIQVITATDSLYLTGIEDFEDYTNYDYSPRQPAAYEEEKRDIHFYMDRSIYRPGQTVYFKGISLTTDFKTKRPKPVAGKKLKIFLQDTNEQDVDSVNVTTNEFGSFAGKFVLPTDRLNGSFRIWEEKGYSNFNVEEYKRPRFSVECDPVKGSYRLGDSITVTGRANSFAANTVSGATVKYRITRKSRWLIRFRENPNSPDWEIQHGEVRTDANGQFSISFKAVPDAQIKKEDPVFFFDVAVDVTDLNGETRSTSTTVYVSYKALLMNLQLPEETVRAGKLSRISILTTNSGGQFQKAWVSVALYKLAVPDRLIRQRYWDEPDLHQWSKEEYLQYFPYDEYDHETDQTTWQRLEKVYDRSDSTVENGVFNIDGKSIPRGWYAVEVTALDKYGETLKEIKFLEVTSEDGSPAKPEYEWNIWKDDITALPGDTLKIETGSSAGVHLLQCVDTGSKGKSWYVFSNINNGKNIFRLPVKESDRGGMKIIQAFVKHNRVYISSADINVSWEKDLHISYETYRDKTLPGSQEQWKVKISGKKKEKLLAEVLTSMYDESLDQFDEHRWYKPEPWPNYSFDADWQISSGFESLRSVEIPQSRRWEKDYIPAEYDRPYLSLRSIYNNNGAYRYNLGYFDMDRIIGKPRIEQVRDWVNDPDGSKGLLKDTAVMGDWNSNVAGRSVSYGDIIADKQVYSWSANKTANETSGSVRKNFNETAFFFPQLHTDSLGNLEFSFTMPESVTKWKWMMMAHTKDLAFAYRDTSIITQKELMVQPNLPRFVREGDSMSLIAKIVNMCANQITGDVKMQLIDAVTNQPVDQLFANQLSNHSFTAPAGESVAVPFSLRMPYGFTNPLSIRFVATSGSNSDGEEHAVPMLSNKMLVTESLPLNVRGNGTKQFKFEKLLHSDSSKTLAHNSVTLEFTSNPAWYAVQSLPYLIEYPYECAEQTWNRFYANALATTIINKAPRIKKVFDEWKKDSTELLSKLQKNEELKSVLMQETPWVMEARNETEQRKNLALLFDMNKMSKKLNSALSRLTKLQNDGGDFSWFQGGPEDVYITQYIATGIGHLKKLNAIPENAQQSLQAITGRLIYHVDGVMQSKYKKLINSKEDTTKEVIGYSDIQYIYLRSFFPEYKMKNREALNFYRRQSQQFWMNENRYMQAMIALALFRTGDKETPLKILKSLKEYAIVDEEKGMYWKGMEGSYYWYEAPIEEQALMIEAFSEIANDTETVDALKTWLLKNKQTNNWHSTIATAEACYALLLQGSDWLSAEPTVQINLGNNSVSSKDEKTAAGTGSFKKIFSAPVVNSSMGNITVNITGGHQTAWGAVYWQYFENIDKISSAATPLNLNKKLFVERNTDRGPVMEPVTANTILKVGDKINVRIELRVDRNMEYVHMKDMRASALEPVNVLSTYRWQDGLGYYESTKDASTNFFFDVLPRGTHVFEYTLFATHSGTFSNGITTIQCMYAPEFTSHSEGIRIKVE